MAKIVFHIAITGGEERILQTQPVVGLQEINLWFV